MLNINSIVSLLFLDSNTSTSNKSESRLKKSTIRKKAININNKYRQIDKFFSIDKFQKKLIRERERADRNGHEFSSIIIDIGKKKHDKTFIAYLYQFLESRLRSIDEIGWYAENKIGILFPYTSAENAMKVAERICKNRKIERTRIVSYPSLWPYKKEKVIRKVMR